MEDDDGPLTLDEQMKIVRDLLTGGDLLFLAVDREDGQVVVVVNPLFTNPCEFGIVLADMVEHVANAYATAGFDPVRVRQSILGTLGDELDFPTGTPSSVKEARDAIPQG